MSNELRTQSEFMKKLYYTLLQILLLVLYCGMYLCWGISAVFSAFKDLLDGGITSITNESSVVKNHGNVSEGDVNA